MKVTIDGHEIDAEKGELVIAAAERAGVYVPRFCYHPRMRTVGMCRMCLVNVDTGRGPALTASCVAEVTDGMVVDTKAAEVKKAQDGVLEMLLVNHPLDCPVCDKGGECPLQDQTLHFGPGETRFVEEKRHFEKPIVISDLVLLDRERCILCDRCTRFSKEVAGDPLIHFINRGNATEVNTFPDHPFASYFSGNVVQICPVGALTSTPYRFTARPWDLERVESTCTSCAVGCRVAIESSANRITRYQGLDSEAVNHSWLCDRGRFDFEWVNADDRLTSPLVRQGEDLVEVSWGEALNTASAQLADVLGRFGPEAVGVIGGARLTNEDCYAWAKLVKGVLGSDNVDAQLGDGLPADVVVGLPAATINDACGAPAVILLAPDVKEELPVLFLRLRDAILVQGLKVVEVTPRPTSLSPLVAASIVYRPGEAAAVVAALVGDVDPQGEVGGVAAAALGSARQLLAGVQAPVVILGRPSLAESSDGIVGAAGAIRRARPDATFLVALRRGNVRGALDLGLTPGMLPGRVGLEEGRAWYEAHWPKVPAERGLDATAMLQAAAEGRLQALVLLGADPLSDFPDRELARRALTSIGCIIALDTFLTESSRHATVVLAAAGYGEKAGTTTNIEGRVTNVTQKVVARGTAWADWMIASELARRLGGDLGFDSVEEVWDEIERLAPAHHGVTLALLRAPGRWDGVVVPGADDPAVGARTLAAVVTADPSAAYAPLTVVDGSTGSVGLRVRGAASVLAAAQAAARGVSVLDAPTSQDATITASDTPRADESEVDDAGYERPSVSVWDPPAALPPAPQLDAYSLRLVSGRGLYDQAVSLSRSPHLAPLAAAPLLRINPSELERLGVAPGGAVRVTSARTSVILSVAAEPGLPRGSASLVFNSAGTGAADLIDASAAVTEVRVETT
ncbi:MAG: NADH-quinone oxidoreductase subunit NuoG [Acidimicrobiales bacterium]